MILVPKGMLLKNLILVSLTLLDYLYPCTYLTLQGCNIATILNYFKHIFITKYKMYMYTRYCDCLTSN